MVAKPKRSRADYLWRWQAGATVMDSRSWVYTDHLPEDTEVPLVPDEAGQMHSVPLPDQEVSRSLGRASLSEEALYVVNLVLQSPAEVLEMITTPVRRRISKKQIARYLRGMGWHRDKVQGTLQELSTYVQELGT